MKKKKSIVFIIIMFVVVTLTISVGYSLLEQKLSVTGKAKLEIPDDSKENEFKSDELSLEYETKSWKNGRLTNYQYNFTLTNTGNENSTDWILYIDIPSDATLQNSWSANFKIENNQLVITPQDFAKIIEPGKSITFGVQIESKDGSYNITDVDLNGDSISKPDIGNTITEEDKYNATTVTFTKNSSWGNPGEYYSQYNVKIENTKDFVLDDWSFEFVLPEGAEISQYYNFNYINQDGIIKITPLDWNSSIEPGKSVEVGFQIKSITNDIVLEKK